jgi:hypothetical protein
MKRAVIAAWLALSCASPVGPMGGPEDLEPPEITSVFPDSGATNVRPKEVVIRFDEVISETPSGAQNLSERVLLSPSDGGVQVKWERNRITVRPRRGFLENTTYVVTLLPGIADLSSNAREESVTIVFSTGDAIPNTSLQGIAFDWLSAKVAPSVAIEARPTADSTVVYRAQGDSIGRYALPFLAPGSYRLRALLDGNANGKVDPRESWDTVTVDLKQSVTHDFYLFPRDTFPPSIVTVIAPDSLTLVARFDRPLAPGFDFAQAMRLFSEDSTEIPVVSALIESASKNAVQARNKFVLDSLEQWRLAQMMADTTTEGRARRQAYTDSAPIRDSLVRVARQDSLTQDSLVRDSLARDTTPRIVVAVSAREPLETDVVIKLGEPLVPQGRYELRAEVLGANGVRGSSVRAYTRPRSTTPPPREATPPARSTVPPPDSLAPRGSRPR